MTPPARVVALSVALSACGLGTGQDPRTSDVVAACSDMVAAQGEEHPAAAFVAEHAGDRWRIELWQGGDDRRIGRAPPDHVCDAVVDPDGHVEVESLR